MSIKRVFVVECDTCKIAKLTPSQTTMLHARKSVNQYVREDGAAEFLVEILNVNLHICTPCFEDRRRTELSIARVSA